MIAVLADKDALLLVESANSMRKKGIASAELNLNFFSAQKASNPLKKKKYKFSLMTISLPLQGKIEFYIDLLESFNLLAFDLRLLTESTEKIFRGSNRQD